MGVIAFLRDVTSRDANFRDVKKLLLETYLAYGDDFRGQSNIDTAHFWYKEANLLDPDNQEAKQKVKETAPTPTPTTTPSPTPTFTPVPRPTTPGVAGSNRVQGESCQGLTGLGTWSSITGGFRGISRNNVDAYCLYDVNVSNFTFEGIVTIESGKFAGFVLGANKNQSIGAVSIGLDYNENKIQLCVNTSTGCDLSKKLEETFSVERGKPYRLRLVVLGISMRMYIDNNSTPIISANYRDYTGGYVGFNVFNSSATFTNIVVRS